MVFLFKYLSKSIQGTNREFFNNKVNTHFHSNYKRGGLLRCPPIFLLFCQPTGRAEKKIDKQSNILINLYWQVNKDNGFSNINLLFSSDSTQKICLFHRTLHIMQVCPCKINWNIGNQLGFTIQHLITWFFTNVSSSSFINLSGAVFQHFLKGLNDWALNIFTVNFFASSRLQVMNCFIKEENSPLVNL